MRAAHAPRASEQQPLCYRGSPRSARISVDGKDMLLGIDSLHSVCILVGLANPLVQSQEILTIEFTNFTK